MQLNQLERHGLISKKIYAQLPPKVEYGLTKLRQTVLPVVMALGKWGDDHQQQLYKGYC
jgi:DNA-binding HxlR family transcriptional regulator